MTHISKNTLFRTGMLLFALINQALTLCGRSPLPINNEEVSQLLSLLLTVGISIWGFWKNNSFTKNAVLADQYKKELKQELFELTDLALSDENNVPESTPTDFS